MCNTSNGLVCISTLKTNESLENNWNCDCCQHNTVCTI